MRIVYIAAGAAGSYCGACARDAALVSGLRAHGHEVLMPTLYTPLRTDERNFVPGPLFYGAINVFLQQRLRFFRRTPRFVDWPLDRPALLKLASRVGISVRPEELGEMTVSVLRGEEGFQRKELERLVAFLGRRERPDVAALTNSLLAGVAPALRRRLGIPLVCGLQGEEAFVACLPQPHRDEALGLLRERVQAIDLFMAPYEAYADEMSEFLAVARSRIRVVRSGVSPGPSPLPHRHPRGRDSGERGRLDGYPFRIGFLSRISPDKGIDILCEAFRILEQRNPGKAALTVAGRLDRGLRGFWDHVKAGLAAGGVADRVEFLGELRASEKWGFFERCDVVCLPSRLVERRGMACLEAMAAGVPVVVPARGIFPEIVALTGGGLLVPPDNPAALADALALLRDEPDRADSLGKAGAVGIAGHFSTDVMVGQTLAVYEEVCAARASGVCHGERAGSAPAGQGMSKTVE